MKVYNPMGNDIEIKFTRDELSDCFHSGDCEDGVAYHYNKHKRMLHRIPIENARKALQCTGGWDRKDIQDMDIKDVYTTLLWISAGNASDNNSLYGIVSTY